MFPIRSIITACILMKFVEFVCNFAQRVYSVKVTCTRYFISGTTSQVVQQDFSGTKPIKIWECKNIQVTKYTNWIQYSLQASHL